MKQVSVIVPIYNVEKYLNQCIDSIIAQTYSSLQIILVDDGSTDLSASIVDEYAKADKRVVAMHKENGGVSTARNAGLDVATGDYVYFADSDDYLQPNIIEVLVGKMQSNAVDMVMCGYLQHEQKGSFKHNNHSSEIINVEDVEQFREFMFSPNLNISALWNKLYKRELIDFRFNKDICWGEDQIFNYAYLAKVRKFYYTNELLYNYNAKYSYYSKKLQKTFIASSLALYEYCDKFINDVYGEGCIDDTMMQLVYWRFLKAVFAGVYYEGKANNKKQANINFEAALKLDYIKNALENFKPKGTMQKLAVFCLKHKSVWLIRTVLGVRDLFK